MCTGKSKSSGPEDRRSGRLKLVLDSPQRRQQRTKKSPPELTDEPCWYLFIIRARRHYRDQDQQNTLACAVLFQKRQLLWKFQQVIWREQLR
jgi:hypothetical protein